MGKSKTISYFDDPIAYAAQEKDRAEYLAGLFHPINAFTADIPMAWIIPNFLPKGYLALLAADPKEGKTCVATALALAVACGTPFAGMPTEQHAVLWLSLEEGPHERRYLLQQTALADPAVPFYTSFAPIAIDTEEGIDALAHWVRQVDAGLVVVDPLHAAHSGRSLMDGWAARKTLKLLRQMCLDCRVSALVLHHAKVLARSRSKRVAENAQLSATASMEIVLTQRSISAGEYVPDPPGQSQVSKCSESEQKVTSKARASRMSRQDLPRRLVTLSCRGRGHFANQTFHLVSYSPLDYARIDFTPPRERKTRERHWAQQLVLELLATGSRHSEQLMVQLHLSESELRSALTNLRRSKLVRVVWRRGHTRRYGLTELGKQEMAKAQRVDRGEDEMCEKS